MSDAGKLFRGEGYHNMRDRDGKYPDGVNSNPNKMADLNFFIETLPKPKEVEQERPKSKEKK